MVFLSNGVKKLAESFMSLGGIVSIPLAFFISRFLRHLISVSFSLTVLKETFTIRNIGSIDYSFVPNCRGGGGV